MSAYGHTNTIKNFLNYEKKPILIVIAKLNYNYKLMYKTTKYDLFHIFALKNLLSHYLFVLL